MFSAIAEGAVISAVCLGVITLALTGLVIVLIVISFQMRKSLQLVQANIQGLSTEMVQVLNSMNEFIRTDLHEVSTEATQLIGKLNELSSDINNKSHALNFLFKPLHFINDKLGADSSQDESPTPSNTIPQTIKWVGSSMVLIKTIKELLKKHGK